MVNLTIEVVVVLLSTIPLYLSVYMLYRQHQMYPDTVLVAMVVAWLSFAMYNTFAAIAYYFLSENIFLIRGLFLSIFILFVEIALGYVNAGRLHPVRFPIISILAASIAYSLFLPNAVLVTKFPNGDDTLAAGGTFRTFSLAGFIYAMIMYTYYTYKIYINSNKELLYWSRLNFIGALILGPFALFTFLIQVNLIVPGITEFILGIGVLISAMAFSRKPQLIYVLPFKAIKLLVIKQGSGLTIYSYMWVKDELNVHTPLFSSAVESINLFSKTAINKGNITEIAFENAILLIEAPKLQDLYYALLATKTTYSLKIGLKKFAKMFYYSFEKHLNSQFIIETSALVGANALIDECFPYVPTID